MVEGLTAVVFVLQAVAIGLDWLLLPRLVFAAALIVLFAIDLEHQILPDVITLPGIVLGFACSSSCPPGWVSSLLGIAVGGGLPWLLAEFYVRVRGMEGLGFGDVKMLAMIGAVLGWPLVLLTLLLASCSGAPHRRRVDGPRARRPHPAPAVRHVPGRRALLAGLWGQPLVDWYASQLWST